MALGNHIGIIANMVAQRYDYVPVRPGGTAHQWCTQQALPRLQDADYIAAGATVADRTAVFNSDIVLKVRAQHIGLHPLHVRWKAVL